MALATTTQRPEIVFFDIETTKRRPAGYAIIEFGAILLCPNTLEKLDRYSWFVRPTDQTYLSDRRNGITREAVASAQTFADIAHEIYRLLNGRIWAGHNIRKWDGPRIREAFTEIKMLAPEPKGYIDSLELLRSGFERRVDRMKLAYLARYFKLGDQKHRSLEDCLMNLEVLKFCATVLFLESSLPNIFITDNIYVSPDNIDLEDEDTSIPPISVALAPRSQKILVFHKNLQLRFFCKNLKVCFSINGKFTDHRGRPHLNFLVYASQRLGIVLKKCDSLAQKLSAGCDSNSEWKPVETGHFDNSPTVRLNLRFVEDADMPRLATVIYSGSNPVEISTFDAMELNPLLIQGNLVDAYFSVETYNYNKKAGIQLVAEKLIVHA